eukprot:UN32755
MEKLSFHFLLSGNQSKMEQLIKIGKSMNNPLAQFHNALVLGDVETRVNVLMEANQLGLAYVMAKKHNLSDALLDLVQKLDDEQIQKLDAECEKTKSELIFPPVPLVPQTPEGWGDWPKEEKPRKKAFDNLPNIDMDVLAPLPDEDDLPQGSDEEQEDDDSFKSFDDEEDDMGLNVENEKEDENWGNDFDFDVSDNDDDDIVADIDTTDVVVCPTEGQSFRTQWETFGDLASQTCSG